MKHEHAELLQAIIDKKTIQQLTGDGLYVNVKEADALYALAYYSQYSGAHLRVKPSTVLVAGIEVPTPRTTPPEFNTYYWLVSAGDEGGVCQYTWDGGPTDQRILAAGMCWNTQADATIAAAAITKLFTGG